MTRISAFWLHDSRGERYSEGKPFVKKPRAFAAGPWESILLREEDAGGRAIGLGYDPDSRAILEPVDGEYALAGAECPIVLAGVLRGNLAPIPRRVPRKVRARVLTDSSKGSERTGRRDHMP
jgi:hypothetical protein